MEQEVQGAEVSLGDQSTEIVVATAEGTGVRLLGGAGNSFPRLDGALLCSEREHGSNEDPTPDHRSCWCGKKSPRDED